MAREDIVGVALVHYACPICGKPMEDHNAILMNKILTKTRANAVNKLNGKCIGISRKGDILYEDNRTEG